MYVVFVFSKFNKEYDKDPAASKLNDVCFSINCYLMSHLYNCVPSYFLCCLSTNNV